MDLLKLTENLSDSNLEPVYLVHGQERFLVTEFLNRLRHLVALGPMADFNYSRKKMSETSGAEIVAEAKSMPMMASKRLIIVDDAEKMKTADGEVLELYLVNPSPETCLVLVGTKFDLRKGMFSKANRRKQVHKAESLQEREIVPFIGARARARNVSLARGVDAAIAVAVGPDCATLDDAVERLGLYAGGEQVAVPHVEEVVSSIRQHSVFEMVEAIGNRQPERALARLEELLGNREEPLRLSALLARHVRQLVLAKILSVQSAGNQEMAGALGVPPFVVKKLVAQSRGFSGARLENALARLADADIALKSSRRPGSLILEEAVMDLCL